MLLQKYVRGKKVSNIQLKDYPELCAVIERIINNGGTCEIKKERNGKVITVVEIDRKLKHTAETQRD